MTHHAPTTAKQQHVLIYAGVTLHGDLTIPEAARGIVLFAHGSGSSRLSPRNRSVARSLQAAGFATLLFDLLTPSEEAIDERTRQFRFDVDLLATRLVYTTDWLATEPATRWLRVGYFGASTGAAAALLAASRRPPVVHAIVSRGGRPDLAGPALARVTAPTLLIVGEQDDQVVAMNRAALHDLRCRNKRLEIVPGATHLFEEPGTLDRVCELAVAWFDQFLTAASQARAE